MLNELWYAVRGMIRKRAEDVARVRAQRRRFAVPPPGAETGLLACELKVSRFGIYDIWRFDTKSLRLLRALEIQAARLRGEAGFVCRCSGRRRAARQPADPPPLSIERARSQVEEIRRRSAREFAAA